MKKNLAKYFSAYSSLYFPKEVSIILEPYHDYQDSELQRVLDEIFSVDERTGFPIGVIQYYLSSAGNPLVKQWLENNLLKPRVKASGSSLEGVTDDLLNEFSRGSGEDYFSYSARLASIRDEAIANLEKLKTSKSD